MSIVRSALAASVAAALLGPALTGCTSSGTATASSDPLVAREQRAVDAMHLKQQYKDVVMGSEVKGQTLVLYVDVNNLYSMDEDSEGAMRTDTLARWKHIWQTAHPHKRGTLRLSLRDYYGNEVTGDTARV
jgi:hypothetical protein